MKSLNQELVDFLKYVMDVHTDQYGNLQIVVEGDNLDLTAERVVEDYLNLDKPKVAVEAVEAEDAEVLITITRPAHGSPDCWYNNYVGQTFRAVLHEEEEDDEETEYYRIYRICNDEPVIAEVGIGSLYVCHVKGYVPDYDVTEIEELFKNNKKD